MKFVLAFSLIGLSLSLAQAFVTAPAAVPARWSRIPHQPLFQVVSASADTVSNTAAIR